MSTLFQLEFITEVLSFAIPLALALSIVPFVRKTIDLL